MKCFSLLVVALLPLCTVRAQVKPAPVSAPASPAAQTAPVAPASPASSPAPSSPAAQAGPSVFRTAAPQTGVAGDWREPSGSVIRIAPCGDALCATLVFISTAAPVRVDGNNPDAALRTRPLCGLQIGQGFRGSDPNKAEGGKLYDPKNGKTYKGMMTSEGNTLLLRGYIGVAMFGRTARWDRVTTPVESCSTESAGVPEGKS